MEEEVEAAVAAVLARCTPKKMQTEHAIDFLEDVISKLEDEAEGLRDQLDK